MLYREAEVVIGTIVAKTSQPRLRKEAMSQMRDQTTILAAELREGVSACDGDDEGTTNYLDSLRRAWTAYKLSTMRPQLFGSRSFGLIALGEIFDCIKRIDEARTRDTEI